MRVEHEYGRAGALVYLAAWDVHRAKLFGRCEPRSGIVAFDALVAQVMARRPYASARRVFWIVDNGSAHRGPVAAARLMQRWPNLVLLHLPIHASWLNQIEIVFSLLQRKVLTPNTFESLFALEDALLAFEAHYQAVAKPFDWKYTRADLTRLLSRLAAESSAQKMSA
jgi:transposase